ncbi:MAG: hypothetical protein AAGE52_22530 [Myxococcota bacterium]
MRFLRHRGFQLAGILAVSGLGLAVAQPEETETEEVGEVEARANAALTPQEQVEEGQAIRQRGTDLSRRVSSLLDEARQERDIIRVTCINDKLTQVNANLRTVEQRLSNLEDAIEAQDTSRGNHEFTVLAVLRQKFVVLDREAAQCIGQDIFETGSTRVVTEIDPETPEDDPTLLPIPEIPVVPFVPPPASPSI